MPFHNKSVTVRCHNGCSLATREPFCKGVFFVLQFSRMVLRNMTDSPAADVVVAGAGPAGLAAGLAMAFSGLSAIVAGPKANPNDGRTSALFQGSIDFLKRIGAWDAICPHAEPIAAIRLIDATGSLFRAPEVTFRATEIGLPAFGYNVPASALTAALESAAAGRVQRIETAGVASLEPGPDHIRLTTAEGQTLTCRLAAGADGRGSICRQAAGIAAKIWSYDQAAVVCSFPHARPHLGISSEFHGAAGPLTVVPMPGNASSLVWVERPAEAQRLAALSEPEFRGELSSRLGGLLGTLGAVGPRRIFPLSGMTAESFGQNRVGLIGEAAHVIPPIGAQGLNLSFRDAATLAELAGDAHARGEDIGSAAVLAAYETRRRPDAASRVWTIDMLNRSLLTGLLPVHLLRGAGIAGLGAFGPLRRLVMREGVSPSSAIPALMRPADPLSTANSDGA